MNAQAIGSIIFLGLLSAVALWGLINEGNPWPFLFCLGLLVVVLIASTSEDREPKRELPLRKDYRAKGKELIAAGRDNL